jgi:outer membrane protein assembly factor BamD (BamD/ComL family)
MKSYVWFIVFLCLFSMAVRPAYPGEDGELYSNARESAKSGNLNFAFMYYRQILDDFPASKYSEQALFGTGEYYFLTLNFRESASSFIKFIGDYPQSKAKPFALMYLLKIAEKEERLLMDDFKKDIMGLKQSIFLFKDYKEHKYRSPLLRELKAVYYIDKVEFYVQGELFAKISY